MRAGGAGGVGYGWLRKVVVGGAGGGWGDERRRERCGLELVAIMGKWGKARVGIDERRGGKEEKLGLLGRSEEGRTRWMWFLLSYGP